jgi:hypothetical protein
VTGGGGTAVTADAGADAGATATASKDQGSAQQQPPHPAALTADDRTKAPPRSTTTLHNVGTCVIIAMAQQGEHAGAAAYKYSKVPSPRLNGAAGYISKVPVYPSTWYEVTLTQTGQVLKLRSSGFHVVDGDSPPSLKKRPLKGCPTPLGRQKHRAAAANGDVLHPRSPETSVLSNGNVRAEHSAGESSTKPSSSNGRAAQHLSLAQIIGSAHLSINKAADHFSMSPTYFKTLKRPYAILSWPSRQIVAKSIKRGLEPADFAALYPAEVASMMFSAEGT